MKEHLKVIAAFAAILAAAIAIVVVVAFPYVTQDSETITVTDKERITKGSGGSVRSKYLIFTEGETFQNSDCLRLFKFDSSDVQSQLREGETYDVRVYGWRIPILSKYRNIIRIQ